MGVRPLARGRIPVLSRLPADLVLLPASQGSPLSLPPGPVDHLLPCPKVGHTGQGEEDRAQAKPKSSSVSTDASPH